MLFNKKSKKYVQLRGSTCGGTRQGKFPGTTTRQDLIEFAISKIFPNGRHQKFGRQAQYLFELGNSSGEEIPESLKLQGKIERSLSAAMLV